MLWIPSDADMGRHPKTCRLTRLLGIPHPRTVGYLHLMWHWCAKYARDGNLTEFDYVDIAHGMMWEGDPEFVIEAMIECRFLDREEGRLTVHDWDKYAGWRLRCLGADAARKRAERRRAKEKAVLEEPAAADVR